ncbi:hypothetical protein BAUCODRAFT_123040 [Baudoinia panamericana UAMH 10762]|uniref:PQ loop repeat protein n=1 Tax=Baudoinia panamericana (strain UAMH 10762) TaxID=717646 RepID=M2LN24_BAUPA|nr:uncharacterized protein BAUCODRAFT_123040 [Baudoinia panamericana UAMH 10762]EMC95742.1 hypothetical protein BAUCODRAFT_123040 [Baudoinia panamericana UAMH 10762]
MDRPTLSNVFGTLGAVCWSVQLIPQVILNYRRQSARGLSSTFMMFWAWAGVPLGVYNIVSKSSIALQVQPQVLTCLSLATWIQCYYYEHKWSVWKALAVVLPVASIMGGIETALVFALQHGIQHDVRWPLTLMAVLAALFLALGVGEQYISIFKHGSVAGISFLFCGIDALGDVTSIVSVLYEQRVNVLGLVIYSVELVLWIGIFACGGYYKLLPWLQSIVAGRRSRIARPEDTFQGQTSIAIHDLPSSTSVFRTPSTEHEFRSRTAVAPSSTG